MDKKIVEDDWQNVMDLRSKNNFLVGEKSTALSPAPVKKPGTVENKYLESTIACQTPDKTNEPLHRTIQEGVLKLPEKYRKIAELFDHLNFSLRLLGLLKRVATFQNISTQVEVLSKRNFSSKHLAQMKYIFPEALQIEKILIHDKKTLCMQPDMKITLQFDVVEGHCEVSDFVALRQVFSLRLYNFFMLHPEAIDVPEAILPEPFTQRSQITIPEKLPVDSLVECQATSIRSEMERVIPIFSKNFSHSAIVAETGVWSISSCISDEDTKTGLLKESPGTGSKFTNKNPVVELNYNKFSVGPGIFDSPLVKLTSSDDSPKTETPAQSIPNRFVPSCEMNQKMMGSQKSTSCCKPTKRVLDFSHSEGDESALGYSVDEPNCYKVIHQDISRAEEGFFGDGNTSALLQETEQNLVCISKDCKRSQTHELDCQHISPCLADMDVLIHSIFKSVNYTSITKEELVYKIIVNNFDIVEKREVEEHINRLEKLVPDWISREIAPSGDILYKQVKQLVDMVLSPPQGMVPPGWEKNDLLIFFATLFYKVWSFRNRKLHEGYFNPFWAVMEIKWAVEEFTGFQSRVADNSEDTHPAETVLKWEPPAHGWLKINVDAATKDVGCAISMVVEALAWASDYAEVCGWVNINFEMDAKEVVETILMDEEPGNWFSLDTLMTVQRRFAKHTWNLSWKPRETNTVADLTAKFSLSNHVSFFIDEYSVDELPSSLVDCLRMDKVAAGFFHGFLPKQLAGLRRLKFIDFGYNNLRGQIPWWFGSFPKLQVLNLTGNQFSGSIPTSICNNLSFLQMLDLSENQLSGRIPKEIGNLTMLKTLYLSHNNLSKEIPEEIGSFKVIENLAVEDNMLAGPIPWIIFNISSLKALGFTYNELSGVLPDQICQNLGVLVGLYLSSNNLSGPIPSKWLQCKELQFLSLSYNLFIGSIPASIGNLTKLNILYLGHNNLKGHLPGEIGHITELEFLAAESNALIGPIPLVIFNNMSSLKVLSLINNKLTGSLPDNLCHNLPTLQGIFLAYNQLDGPIPSQLLQCEELQNLVLADNGFAGSIPTSITNLTNLKNLDLGSNNLTGMIPEEIGDLYNLEILSFELNHLNGRIPFKLFNISTMKKIGLTGNQLYGHFSSSTSFPLPNLEELAIGMNNFSGSILHFVSNASQLTRLDVAVNSFSGSLTYTIGRLRKLQWLSLSSNNFIRDSSGLDGFFTSLAKYCKDLTRLDLTNNILLNSTFPNSVGNISSLEYLRVTNCTMRGNIPSDFGNLTSLTTLGLDSNELSGSIPPSIGRLNKLQGLFLDDNHLQGFVSSEICQLDSLVDLFLANNVLFGHIPTCLGNLTSLRHLYLYSNELNSTIPTSLWSIENILNLDMSSNSLVGSLHPGIGSLKVVVAIDLSNNKLSGKIPDSIGDLQYLVNFSLARNRLEGLIPTSLGNLISLELLDLSRNNLSGVIPKSFETLSRLAIFNVSVNHLRGEIPTGGPFANFSSSSFMQNDGLCGALRLQVLPCKTSVGKRSNAWKYVVAGVTTTVFIVLILFLVFRIRNKNNNTENADLLPVATLREISYKELVEATDGFDGANSLGTGSSGSVYRGKLNDGKDIAIKVFNLEHETTLTRFNNECEVLFNLRHRNIIRIISIHNSRTDFKALILEYMPLGSLENWLHNNENDNSLSMLLRLSIIIDVASALDYLHHGYSTSIVHSDIKPSNILLDNDMVAHVADFGNAKLLNTTEIDTMVQTATLATIGYMAPEYGQDGIVSTRGDVYSYGIVLMEIFTRKKPTDNMFNGDLSLMKWVEESLPHNVTEVVDTNLIGENFSAVKDCVSSIMELALNCVAESPEERKLIKDVLAALCGIRVKFLKDIQDQPSTSRMATDRRLPGRQRR
ncbi:hypothetical protein FNV43_RR21169 [Rhamnella rubrinervis]|uniref:non-specific serine/threonine protein kinase n=1 Tax=Rhamnella rubrinervis TaxID=2594499 RepID=A0A8K0DVS1_9ROSA|nr:hypothetical protein FNV43_RR21169 [Rhamnella rubrinervis]